MYCHVTELPQAKHAGHGENKGAVCVPTLVNPVIRSELSARIPPGLDNPNELDPDIDYSQFKSRTISSWADTEIDALEHLTEKGCKGVPRLIGYSLHRQGHNGYVPGGYTVHIIMEKVPGRNLIGFGDFPLVKRDKVRMAFAKALMYAH